MQLLRQGLSAQSNRMLLEMAAIKALDPDSQATAGEAGNGLPRGQQVLNDNKLTVLNGSCVQEICIHEEDRLIIHALKAHLHKR